MMLNVIYILHASLHAAVIKLDVRPFDVFVLMLPLDNVSPFFLNSVPWLLLIVMHTYRYQDCESVKAKLQLCS